ncbi:MAG: C25 family cysteine peptidase [Candidatus Brocadiaceae bacterium]
MKIKYDDITRNAFLKKCLFLSMFIMLLFGLNVSACYTALAKPTFKKNLKVVRSDKHAIELELKVGNFRTETTQHEGQTYQRFIIPDMEQNIRPGEPQVPTCGTLLGILSDKDVKIQILKSHYKTLKGHRLYPAPDFRIIGNNPDNLSDGKIEQEFSLNKDIYTANTFYPRNIADMDYTGYLRDQAVAHVQFYPVQYNPVTGEVRLYQHILVRVTWDTAHASKPQRFRGFSPEYEDVLENTLQNYRFLNRSHHTLKAPLNPFNNDTNNILSLAPSPTLKIGVQEDGIYKLTYTDITNGGFSLTNVDPSTIRITNHGTEIPIYVFGEEDGVFDTTDYILFFGTAITDRYTSRNVYWLSTGGNNGLRMSKRSGIVSDSAPVATQFPATLHAEQDTYYWQNIPNGKDQDHWFWGNKLTAPTAMNYPLILNNISSAADNARVRVQLRGYTTISNINPDHHTRIYLNNNLIDDKQWDGQTVFDHDISIPHSYLIEGTNTASVELVKDTGATVDQVFLNRIEINYFDTYVAEDNKLVFTTPSSNTLQFDVTGFSQSDIEVFDITNPENIILITDTRIITSENGLSTVQFEDTPPQETQYLALLSTQYKTPVTIENDQPSTWKSLANGADYIIITHDDFYTNALKLANYRSASGLRVVTVKTSDIYDEFNYGIFNPQAIRDFLTYAYNNWVAPAPLSVLLVGDACFDSRDNLKTGTINYVPSPIIETTIIGETPSDNWYVLVSGGDVLPDMFIGRLSAQSTSQANTIVNKILYYEKNTPDKSWNKNVLLVADDDEPVFNQTSEDVSGLLPFNYKTNKVYVNTYTSGLINPTTDITNYINNGNILVNYSGHGSVNTWGLWKDTIFFSNSQVNALVNAYKMPFVTILNCMNGYFTGPKSQPSIAETFQRLGNYKGAIAVLAASGWDYPAGQRVLIRNLYKTIFEKNQFFLGAAITAAKINTYTTFNSLRELVEMFVLFGDPLTKLGIGSRLTILNPNGNEIIPSGSLFPIQWVSSRDMVNFTLKYSTDNGDTWITIAEHVKGTQYSWNPPIFETDMNECLIQAIGFDSSNEVVSTDTSDATFTIPATVTPPEPVGLNALYTFDEGSGAIAHDTSGNGNDGTINGATWTIGKNEGALSFNGTSSYVSIANSLPAFSEFTCTAWIKAADLTANRGIFTSGGLNTRGFRFRINKDGSVWLMMAGGGTSNTVSTAGGIIQSGSFYHISVTGKSGQYMRIYVNGVLAKEKITTQTVDTPTAPGYIGTSWSKSSELMNGIIDDVCIYNRALSNQEVLNVYNKTNTVMISGSITINDGAPYSKSTDVILNLAASDDIGITGYYLSLSAATPSVTANGWVAVTPVQSYRETVPYTLSSGDGSKTVYVWYKDSDGNISATASDSIIVDMTTPVVAITSPASASAYTSLASTINLSGNVTEGGSGISSVTSSDKGGSGTASGGTGWTISGISLTDGDTIIMVTATDGAGNTGTDTITVSYSETPTSSGLSALYTFDEGSGATAHDTSGNGNNGTINGAAWTGGKYGSALSFNGASSYVSISNSLLAFSEFTVLHGYKQLI